MDATRRLELVWREYRYYNNDRSEYAVHERRRIISRAIRIAKEAEKNGK